MTNPAPAFLPRLSGAARILFIVVWGVLFAATILANLAGLVLAFGMMPPAEVALLLAPGIVAAAAMLAVSLLLVRRDAGDGVGALIALSALAAAAYVGSSAILFAALEMDWLGTLLPSLWIGLLVAAIPAFPDGRYDPRWGRLITWGAIPFTIAISADTVMDDELVLLGTALLGFGVAILALVAAVARFRRTPPGLERQQLKWAALGVGGCVGLLILTVVIAYAAEGGLFSDDWLAWIQLPTVALHDFAFAWLASCLLIALLRLRLWDADRAIGRSLGLFLLTLVIACVWAACAALVNDFVSSQIGSGNKGLGAAISTIVALLVFGPARERVNTWVEKRLQRGIVQLRKLPDRLAVWQHLDDPEAFGTRVATAVADCLHAGSSAVLLFADGAFRPIAAVGVERSAVEAWIAGRGSFSELASEDRTDPDFPLRLILTDEEVLIGALLVGRRSDGSSFAREERETLFKLEPALAASLHRVRQRTLASRAVGGALADLDARLERVERTVRPAA